VHRQEGEEEEIKEILSSIRKIMDTDGKEVPTSSEGVLELTNLVQDDGTVVPVEESSLRTANIPMRKMGEAYPFSSEKGAPLTGMPPLEKKAAVEKTPSHEKTEPMPTIFLKKRKESVPEEPTTTESFLSLIEKNAENLQCDAEKPLYTSSSSSTQSAVGEKDSPLSPPEEDSIQLSPRGQRAVLDSLARLHHAATPHHASVEIPSSNLEDVVKTALKPLLASWIERHLPRIVEVAVEKEIHRLTEHLVTQETPSAKSD
jgi:cell pole-organizing protein PopZ